RRDRSVILYRRHRVCVPGNPAICNLKNAIIFRMDCKHFGICGGCRCRDEKNGSPKPLPYAEELLRKEALVHDLLSPYPVEEWRPIIPSPDEWHYRNKMEYSFGAWGEGLVLGLRQEGRFDRIVDLETCGLMSGESMEVLGRVRRWALDGGLAGYHRRRHEG